MTKVQIITDSGAHFADPSVPERLGITVVPQIIQLGSQQFREGADLEAEEFFRRLPHFIGMPAAQPPSVDEFRTLYATHTRRNEQILSIHTSARMSTTIGRARQAADEFLGRGKIVVLDSMSTSLGLGILVEAAAEAAARGEPLDELVRIVRGMVPHLYAVYFTESLDYLERAGRLSKSQSILGTMLGIKPFLTIEEGEIIPMEKVRTREKAIEKLVEFVSEFSYIERVAIMQSGEQPTEDTRLLLERLEQTFPGQYFPVLMYGASLACLIGPDSLGIVIYEGAGRPG
ncbi:MAG TPA: DegV family protein [Anaerolineae bacterium]|nr:DegV family protein [Anaerolineae bacterium]